MEGRIKIGTSAVTQLESMGMYIADSDKLFSPPQTEMEEQYFPELGKSTIHPATHDKPFDWKMKMGIMNGAVGGKIYDFFLSIKGKPIELYNDYSRIKIVGYIKSVGEADKFQGNIATFPITIRVNDPSKCNFKL